MEFDLKKIQAETTVQVNLKPSSVDRKAHASGLYLLERLLQSDLIRNDSENNHEKMMHCFNHGDFKLNSIMFS